MSLECLAEAAVMTDVPRKKKKKKKKLGVAGQIRPTQNTLNFEEQNSETLARVDELEVQLREAQSKANLVTEISKLPACSIRISGGFQRTKKVDDSTMVELAASLNADTSAFNLTKNLHDCKHPAIKKVNAAVAEVKRYVDSMTLPYYVEPGTRLLLLKFTPEQQAECKDKLVKEEKWAAATTTELDAEVHRQLTDAAVVAFRVGLQNYISLVESAVKHFNENDFEEVLIGRKQSLGAKFNRHDYGNGVFINIEVREKTIVPPSYHGAISPELKRLAVEQFQRDCVTAKGHMVDSMVTNLQDMLERLHERMDGKGDNNQPKVFRDSLVTNISEGINWFSTSLQSRGLSSSQLDSAVADIQSMLKNIGSPNSLRSKNYRTGSTVEAVRAQVAVKVTELYDKLNAALIVKPPRKLSDSPFLKKKQKPQDDN